MNSKPISNAQTERRAKYMATMSAFNIIDHGGILTKYMPNYIELLAGIKQMVVRPTDIWICGYRKSGNTWLSEIVSLIMADGVVDRVRDRPISERVPHIYSNDFPKPTLEFIDELSDPRIMINHLPVNRLPSFHGIHGKLIYIMRNPKDCCLSAYHFHHTMKLPAIDWDDFYRLFLEGYVLNGDWFQHVSDFWLTYGSNHPNVLFVAYEELSADLPAMVRTIARFLGKQFTDETVAAIVTHCTADAMRDNPMANRSEFLQSVGNSGAKFVRKATVGQWKRHMTGQQSHQFDELYGQRLRAIGLPVCDDMADARRCMRDTGRIIINE